MACSSRQVQVGCELRLANMLAIFNRVTAVCAFTPPPIQQMSPESLCYRVVCPPVRTSHSPIKLLAACRHLFSNFRFFWLSHPSFEFSCGYFLFEAESFVAGP